MEVAIRSTEAFRAWGRILRGYRPVLSIEITTACPLSCPGCYAFQPEHVGGVPLESLADYAEELNTTVDDFSCEELLTFAKLWFMLTGWALYFILPRIFKWSVDGDEKLGMALFGAYGIVFTGVSVINNGVITGTIQAVSKFITTQNRALQELMDLI